MEKGKIIIPKSKDISIGVKTYYLKRKIETEFLDWKGAFAGFYALNPLTNKETNLGINYTCPLGFFKELLYDLANEYDSLKNMPIKKLRKTGLERRFNQLLGLFSETKEEGPIIL